MDVSESQLDELENTLDAIKLRISSSTLPDLADAMSNLERAVWRIRVTPIQPLLEQYEEAVSLLASKAGKKAVWRAAPVTLELPVSVRDVLSMFLLHAVRNAIDHGIEQPEERRRKKKEAVGTIRFEMDLDRGVLRARIWDDGRGPDIEAIAKTALSRNLVSPMILDKMTDEEKIALVFRPGFSTKDQADLSSGRGVGLDAVKTAAKGCGGSVDARIAESGGFLLEVSVPLSAVGADVVEAQWGSRKVFVLKKLAEQLRGATIPAELPLKMNSRDGRSVFQYFRQMSGAWSEFGEDWVKDWARIVDGPVLAARRGREGEEALTLLVDDGVLHRFESESSSGHALRSK